jgi:hypothetical protein
MNSGPHRVMVVAAEIRNFQFDLEVLQAVEVNVVPAV